MGTKKQMSEKATKIPQIRFDGYTDAWEQRKFADFIDVKSGKDYKHLNSGPIPVYGTGGYMLSVDRALSDIDAIGIGRKGTIDKPYLLKAPFWTVDTLFYAVPKQNIDLQFSLSIFKKINWKKFDESTGVPSLSKTVINSVGASVPCYEEQQKIGSFFQQLDNTITLHQRECDLLAKMKKSYLQKMFPKNGEDKPEIRFAGFTDAWEQRKAGEIFKSVSDKGYTDLPVLSASQELGMILRDEIGIDIKYDESSIKNYKRVKPGQFVIHLRSFQGGFSWSDIEGITSPAYTILDYQEPEEHCSKFWKIVLTSPMFITRLETVTYGIRDGRSISFTDFSTLNLNVPSIAEQQKIGEYFSKLDNLITLHQRELDSLKKMKKSLLQMMFV